MERKGVTIGGHRVHQALVAFPLGLLGGAAIFDIVHLINDNPLFAQIAYWLIAVGVIAALVAALFGALDYGSIPRDTRAKRVALVHGAGNVVVTALFIVSWFLRRGAPDAPGGFAIALCLIAFALAGVTGYLGGELVNKMGIGVAPDANPNASSHVSGAPTRAAATA